MKVCMTCKCRQGEERPDLQPCDFAARRGDCRVCQREYTRKLRERMIAELMERLGGKCQTDATSPCKGWPLQFDHVAGDGDEERGSSMDRGGSDIGQLSGWLKELDQGIVRVQLLCPRHHQRKTRRDKAFLKAQARRTSNARERHPREATRDRRRAADEGERVGEVI